MDWLSNIAADHSRLANRRPPAACPCERDAALVDAAGELLVVGLDDATLPPGTYMCTVGYELVCECRDRRGV